MKKVKIAIIDILFCDKTKLHLEYEYIYICEVFGKINSALILKNRAENEIFNLKINFMEV